MMSQNYPHAPYTYSYQNFFFVRDIRYGFGVLDHLGNQPKEDQVDDDTETEGGQEERVEGNGFGLNETHRLSHIGMVDQRHRLFSLSDCVRLGEHKVTDQGERNWDN